MGKGPRLINPVSILVILAIIGAIYAAVKFLADAKHDAAQLDEYGGGRDKLIEQVREKIIELGIEGDRLDVYLEDDLSYIHADYVIVVEHPFGKTTELEFERSVKVPRD